jgi:hypothetical protein
MLRQHDTYSGARIPLIVGWQVFKQLLLEGRHGVATNAADAAVSASSDAKPSSGSSSSKAADNSMDSTASSMKALQEQVRKLQLQVRWPCYSPILH